MGKSGGLVLRCGSKAGVREDVNAFARFYGARFRDEALGTLEARVRRRALVAGVSLCGISLLSAIPLLVNAQSVFAYLLLAMGAVLLAAGVFFLARAVRAHDYCEMRFDRLLAADFESACSETKRVFDLALDGEGIEVRFGVTSGVPQKRRLGWAEVRGVYLTDDLVFIQGLTWVCRTSTPPETYEALIAELRRRMPAGLVDNVRAG